MIEPTLNAEKIDDTIRRAPEHSAGTIGREY
jgi:hypothetical protein